MQSVAPRVLLWLMRLLALGLFVLSVNRLGGIKPVGVVEELQVALPRFVQVMMAMGDRYLAANIATFRAMVASTSEMKEENFRVQGQVQRDAAWLNPAHEDNYYVAAAILPWHGQFEAAQDVLALAMEARPYDWQPAFYYAFNLYYIKKQPIAAADVLLKAAPKVGNERNRMMMESLAYGWYEKGYEPHAALNLLEASAKTARVGMLRRYLLLRAERLRGLLRLQEAAALFRNRHGRPPGQLDELVKSGFIDRIPDDPFGNGYGLNQQGEPVLLRTPGGKR